MSNQAPRHFFGRVSYLSRHSFCSRKVIPTASVTNAFEFLSETSSADWKSFLRNGREVTSLRDSVQLEERGFADRESSHLVEKLAKRLERELKNGYFAHKFRQLSACNDPFSNWQGILALKFARAAEQQSKKPGHRRLLSYLKIAEVANYMLSNLIFHEELLFAHPSSQSVDLVNDYFIASSIRVMGQLNNLEAFKEFSSLLSLLVMRRPRECQQILRSINEWEFESFNAGGHIAATACKTMLETGRCSKGMQELGYQFGRIFHMAAMAQSDLQHFLNYGKKLRSSFRISSLPIVLHLEQNPGLYVVLYKLRNRMDNIDLHNVYAEIHPSSSITRAKSQLQEYVQALKIILKELPPSDCTKDLNLTVDTLGQLKE